MQEPARPWQRRAAAALALAVLGCVATGVTCAVLLDFSVADAMSSFLATNATMGAAFGLCGALLVRHRPANPVGWLLAADGLGHAVAAAAAPAALLAAEHGAPVAVQRMLVTVFTWSWPWSIALFLPLALLLFPDGRPPSRGWRWVVAATVVTAPLFVLEMGLDPQSPDDRVPAGYLTLPSYDQLSWLWTAAELRVVLLLALALAALGLRHRRGTEQLRRQLLWLLLATLALVVAVVAWAFVHGTPVGVLFVLPLVPAAITVAILRHNLLDIRLLVSRAVVYGALSSAVFAAYAGLVAVLGTVVQARFGPGVLAALLVALAFGPARSRLQRVVDRALYGDRRDPARAIGRIGAQLTGGAGGLDGVVTGLRESLRLPYVAVLTPGRVLAESGDATAPSAEQVLCYADRPVGSLVVGLRRGETELAAADRALLDLVAAPLALALHATRLTGQLQQSRERAATAREEERRRLRRDLHDGLGPQLTGVAYRTDAAANLLDADPAEASRLLAAASRDTRAAIDDIRRLVYGLRPPALDQLGLVGALSQQLVSLRRDDGTPVHADLEAPALPELPPAVEVAAYRIATEAVANAARHSTATRLVVRLRHPGGPTGDDLLVEVTDNGRPVNGAWRPGVGLTAMSERADELGGDCHAGPTAEGGRVVARLPVGTP
ncbi:MAG: histidine kinase [Sporichthyaceae bacterium]